jgi:antitoxin (DNA-binding transcriptional repressor) of toxin-antitoxin stability system
VKVISVMKVRQSLGQILDEVNLKSETFILERAGKPIAKIIPMNSEGPQGNLSLNLKALRDLKGLNPQSERSSDPSEWLDKERGEWE